MSDSQTGWARPRGLIASVIVLFYTCAAAANTAAETTYKFRVHRNFAQEMFANNMRALLDHTDEMVPKETYLPEVDTVLERVSLKVVSKQRTIATEIILDETEDSFVVSMSGLSLKGMAHARVGNKNALESIVIDAPLDSAIAQMQLGQQITALGDVLPRVSVLTAQFALADRILISSFGDLPLY